MENNEVLTDKAPTKPKKSQKHHFDLFKAMRYVKLNWLFIGLALIAAIAESIVGSYLPDLTGKLFEDSLEMSKLYPVIWNTLLTILLYSITQVLLMFAQSQSSISARKSVWKKLMNVKMSFYDQNSPGSYLNTVTADAEGIGTGIASIFVQIPAIAVMIISCIRLVSAYSGQILILIMTIVAIHLIYMVVSGIWTKKIATVSQIKLGKLTGFIAERIRNMPMIKAFGTQYKETENGKTEINELYNIGKKSAALAAVTATYQGIIYLLANVICVIWCSALIRAGELTNIGFLVVFTYVAVINIYMIMVTVYYTLIQTYNGMAYRVIRLCEAPQESDDEKTGITKFENGDIKFNNVSFGYNVEQPIIRDVSFTIRQGKITALVGPSGSGKTTIVKLLENFYSPTDGSITIDGQPIQVLREGTGVDGIPAEYEDMVGEINIQEINTLCWRNKIAYVVQDAGIFGGTLKECLTYGVNREVTEEELIAVTKQTGLYDWIQTQLLGFMTPVASWGASLSGGQRQRIVISRALLRNADILIFDEPTSALDPETANQISKLILENFNDKTVIIISHELNYISKADNIVFLHDGKLEGEGTHDELMKACPAYKSLVEQQSYQEVFE